MHEFRLQDTSAALVSASPNKEKHGEEWIDRVDLRLSKQGNTELLDQLVDNAASLVALLWAGDGHRLPGLKRLVFDHEIQRHRVTIVDDYGNDIVLTDAKINEFKADLDDMSICDVSFRVQAYPGAAEDMGLLAHLQRDVVRVTIAPQDEDAEDADDGQGDIEDAGEAA